MTFNMTQAPPPETIYVFIDHSNLFHQAQETVPRLLGLNIERISQLAFDYGALLDKILDSRRLGEKCVVVASTPSPHEVQLRQLDDDKFRTILFERHYHTNKEKGVDVALAVEAMEAIMSHRPPSTIALVAGDGDYKHLLDKALGYGWTLELYFWPNSECAKYARCLEFALTSMRLLSLAGVSKRLASPQITIKDTLQYHFKEFTYAYGSEPGWACSLEVVSKAGATKDDMIDLAWKIRDDGFVWFTQTPHISFKLVFLDKASMETAAAKISTLKPEWDVFKYVPHAKKRKRPDKSESSLSQTKSSYVT